MNTFEITELGQVREQENMLARAQAQSLRQAQRDARVKNGAAPSPPWLVTFLGMKKRSSTPQRCSQPHAAHESAGR